MTEPTGQNRDPPEIHYDGPAGRLRLRALLSVIAVVVACMLFFGAWFVSRDHATGRAMHGVKLGELDASGLDRAQIESDAVAWAAPRAARRIVVSLAGTRLVFEPKTVGFALDQHVCATRALAVGRSGSWFARFSAFVARCFRPEVVPFALELDAAKLTSLLDAWQDSAIKDPPFAGGITISGVTLTPIYPRSGTQLDRVRVQQQLLRAIVDGELPEPLATRFEAPAVERAEVDRVLLQAQSMLASEIELGTSDGARRLRLSPAQVGSVLTVQAGSARGTLQLVCAPAASKRLVDPQRAALEEPAKNARFVVDAQDHVHVEPGQPGLFLSEQALANAICTAAASSQKKALLPAELAVQPAFTTEAAEHAGIVGLMASFTTHHACCQPRVKNIHHIADLLDGTLVAPGETFSLNQLIGPRTLKNGFRPAPSIEDGDMVDTVGGGVSQFATTLFNALFYGGYDIVERQPHSYWFTRYPMGYDATLSYPHPDIVFKNDTSAAALIKTQYTDTTITVKIYGDNGGRRVRAEVSERQNIVPPPLELIPNPALDADQEKTREGGMIGWTVTVKRTLTFPDGKVKEERRKVTYKPRVRRVEVHPCRIPEGEPGHTGERCPKPAIDDASAAADASAK